MTGTNGIRPRGRADDRVAGRPPVQGARSVQRRRRVERWRRPGNRSHRRRSDRRRGGAGDGSGRTLGRRQPLSGAIGSCRRGVQSQARHWVRRLRLGTGSDRQAGDACWKAASASTPGSTRCRATRGAARRPRGTATPAARWRSGRWPGTRVRQARTAARRRGPAGVMRRVADPAAECRAREAGASIGQRRCRADRQESCGLGCLAPCGQDAHAHGSIRGAASGRRGSGSWRTRPDSNRRSPA